MKRPELDYIDTEDGALAVYDERLTNAYMDAQDAEIARLRELVAGEDDGGHWYSQASMDAVIRERDKYREALTDMLAYGVELDDPRVPYLTVQIGRETIEAARKALGVGNEH
jgi:hypothetical protein